MKRKMMFAETKIPVYGIKIVFLVGKGNLEIIIQDFCNLVESFQATVIIDNGLGEAEGGS